MNYEKGPIVRSQIRSLASKTPPFDREETEHIAFVEKWIDSGVEIFRIAKPATPSPHLVAYFLLIDPEMQQVLLVDHKKANLWLPAGGHVEPNEHPKETVSREIIEELGVQANFLWEMPFFLTVTETTGDKDKHVDVSFWYVLKASSTTAFKFDEREFYAIQWFAFDEIPLNKSDPHMKRLLQKLILHKLVYRNNLKNRFLAVSASQHLFGFHSRLALEQCSSLQTQKSARLPGQNPDPSSYFGI